jgi:hypothetical protein
LTACTTFWEQEEHTQRNGKGSRLRIPQHQVAKGERPSPASAWPEQKLPPGAFPSALIGHWRKPRVWPRLPHVPGALAGKGIKLLAVPL